MREETALALLLHDNLSEAKGYLYGMVIAGKLKVPNTCALQALDAFRTYYGVSGYPETDSPYLRKYDAVTRVEELGKKLGLLERVKLADGVEPPEPGDFLRSGEFPHEHVSCIADYDAARAVFVTVDGGQGDGSETKRVERMLVIHKGEWWLVNADKPWVTYGKDEVPNGKVLRVIIRMSKYNG